MAIESVPGEYDALLRACGFTLPRDRIGPASSRRLRDAVYELAREFGHETAAVHAIHGVIRQKFGCRVTDLRERDLEDALELLVVLKERVGKFVSARHDFERRAMRRLFGTDAIVAAEGAEFEGGVDDALSKLDEPFELPLSEPIVYGGNVVRFPGHE